MTDTVTTGGKAPLGVGSIISESFSILFANFVKVLMIAFIPTVVGLLISGAFLGFGVALGMEDPAATLDPNDLGGFFAGIAIAAVIQMVIYGLVIALMVQLAYDAIVGRPVKLVEYFGPALRAALPIAVLTFVATILYGIGFALLIVPGLWLYAVFSVTAPAVVIDKVGFGGLGRSARLTKEYRWPLVGLFIVILIIVFAVSMVANFAAIATGSIAIALVISALINSIGSGLLGISSAIAYARLREIKEGVGVEQIVEVFD